MTASEVEMSDTSDKPEGPTVQSLVTELNDFATHVNKQLTNVSKELGEQMKKVVADAIAANNPQIVAMAAAAAKAVHSPTPVQAASESQKTGEPETPESSPGSADDAQNNVETITPSSQERDFSSPTAKISLNPPKPFAGKGTDVEQFLRKLKQYLRLSKVSISEWVEYASTFLDGHPDKLWHSEYANLQQTMNPVPWEKFENFMHTTFGTIAPLSEAYKEYEHCKQTGTVAEFASRLRACALRLKGTFLEQSEGSLTIKFFNGLKPSILKLVEDSAPAGWWTSTEQVFEKAINFELNQAAALGRPNVQSAQATEENVASSGKRKTAKKSDPAGKPKKQKVTHDIYIPPEEFKRRQAAKRCTLCGQAGHNYKKCTNERTAQPFA